jgi:hypothetical protein
MKSFKDVAPPWVEERLRSCPRAGQGVNAWLFSTTRALAPYFSEEELVDLLKQRSAGCGRAVTDTEARRQVSQGIRAANQPKTVSGGGQTTKNILSPSSVPIGKIEFKPEELAKYYDKGPKPTNWVHYLYGKSPCRPEGGLWFLNKLYHPGEKVLLFTAFKTDKPALMVTIGGDLRELPGEIHDNPSGEGTWFLSNPVDGKWHPNPRADGKMSCRSEEAVTAYRYAVLESDLARPDHWLSFLVQLPAPIVAIYTSGGKSIHALIKVDAPTKEAWDEKIRPLKGLLKRLGADPNALTAVRLSRLPGCHRREKEGFQELLFLNPNPSEDAKIMDLPNEDTREDLIEPKG